MFGDYTVLLISGWNSNGEAEVIAFGYLQIACWIDTCRRALWFHCWTWCQGTRTSHVNYHISPFLLYNNILAQFYLVLLIDLPYMFVSQCLGWSALHCTMMARVSVNIFHSFLSSWSPIHFQLGQRYIPMPSKVQ